MLLFFYGFVFRIALCVCTPLWLTRTNPYMYTHKYTYTDHTPGVGSPACYDFQWEKLRYVGMCASRCISRSLLRLS